ncbi:vacuolar protein sorting-associated protein 52 homolog, partial [Leucoraja erinacea]|uniref:vacuolar protein sorting-associated protein 52 homolog n=1 Tax=Leucoraja erinaceus TaxID=7782 RepID=UPI0024587736
LTAQCSFSKSLLKNRNTIFTLGNRGNVIASSELEAPIIVPHVAQKNDTRYPFESLFRSQHYGLLDNSCREYLFLCDFFMVTGNSAQDLFNAIKGKTLSIVLVSLSRLLPLVERNDLPLHLAFPADRLDAGKMLPILVEVQNQWSQFKNKG